MKELPRKKSPLLRITTRNEDQTLDRNNGLEVKISKEETRTSLTTDLGAVPLLLTRNFLPRPNPANGNSKSNKGRSYDQRRN